VVEASLKEFGASKSAPCLFSSAIFLSGSVKRILNSSLFCAAARVGKTTHIDKAIFNHAHFISDFSLFMYQAQKVSLACELPSIKKLGVFAMKCKPQTGLFSSGLLWFLFVY
jgi:hypothetical protein